MPDSNSKLLVLLDKISEISERTARMEVTQDHMKQDLDRMKDDIEVIKKEDAVQNQLLAEHIAGTVANTNRLELEIKARQDLEARISKLEETPKFLSFTKKIAQYVAIIVGAAIAIKKLFHF